MHSVIKNIAKNVFKSIKLSKNCKNRTPWFLARKFKYLKSENSKRSFLARKFKLAIWNVARYAHFSFRKKSFENSKHKIFSKIKSNFPGLQSSRLKLICLTSRSRNQAVNNSAQIINSVKNTLMTSLHERILILAKLCGFEE